MQVVRTIPAVARLPEVLVFYCEGCGEVETRARPRCLICRLAIRSRRQSAARNAWVQDNWLKKVTSGFEPEQLIARPTRGAN
jgi:hypothetical protein